MRLSTLKSDDAWVETDNLILNSRDQHDATRRSRQTGASALDPSALENVDLLSEYFEELRRFDLLSKEDEMMLWRRIERWKRRARRALYISPIALPTLQAIWREVKNGERSLDHIINQTETAERQKDRTHAQIGQALRHLSALSAKRRSLKWQRLQSNATRDLQTRRQAFASLWRDWLATCEQIGLHTNIHQEMEQTLEREQRRKPDDLGLRIAYHRWSRAQHKLEQAKAQILCANLRFVVYMAKQYRDRELPLPDLIQEGNIGLMRAIERFEPERGLKFVTYAYWWVRQSIGRALIEQGGSVRLPTYVVERQQKLRAASERLYQRYARWPTSQELSAELGWTCKEIERLWGNKQVVLRLHTPLTDDGWKLEDVLRDDRVSPPEVELEARELQQCVALGLAGLTTREARVLSLRFGLENDRSHNLREIGEQLGLSHERIRQIERKALDKLRAPELGASLADFQARRAPAHDHMEVT